MTHSLPTITGNAVSMIAGGNSLVVNPHPSGKKVAAALDALGVQRGDRVCAVLPNTPQTVAVFLAVASLGGHAEDGALIDPRMSRHDAVGLAGF